MSQGWSGDACTPWQDDDEGDNNEDDGGGDDNSCLLLVSTNYVPASELSVLQINIYLIL